MERFPIPSTRRRNPNDRPSQLCKESLCKPRKREERCFLRARGRRRQLDRYGLPSPSWRLPHEGRLPHTHTFGRLNKILKEGVVLRVTNVLVDGDSAVVETESLSTALNGKPFNNRYCWIVRFSDGTLVEVRAYLDSALVERLIDENEPSVGQQEQKSR